MRQDASFETPNKSGGKSKSITPAKAGTSRRLDVENVRQFEQNKKRRKEDAKPRKPEQVHQPLSIYKTEIYEAKVGNKPDRDECWGTSARKEFLAKKSNKIVYNFVVENFIVPPNFDTSLSFGARSGMCHEQRLLRAYKNRLLKLKPEVSRTRVKNEIILTLGV